MADAGLPEYSQAELEELASLRLRIAEEISPHEDYIKALFPYRPAIDFGLLQQMSEHIFAALIFYGGADIAKRIVNKLAEEAVDQSTKAVVGKIIEKIKGFWSEERPPSKLVKPNASPSDPEKVSQEMIDADITLQFVIKTDPSSIDQIIVKGAERIKVELIKEGLPEDVSTGISISVSEQVRARAGELTNARKQST